MNATSRPYRHETDYERVNRFLERTYGMSGGHVNWLQPRWEYMHFHPLIHNVDLGSIGLWEADGEIVGVAHPEHGMGQAYFEFHPDHGDLKREMLEYAEARIRAIGERKESLSVYINDRDIEFRAIARDAGFVETDRDEPMSHLPIADPYPEIELPDGFRLRTLADGNDIARLNRVLFRGFGHGDEPPDDGFEERTFMQSAPNYRMDLNVVVEAPDGTFASYCGMWIESANRVAYVEPVATDPDYRRMGLGAAAVREGIHRCGQEGATVAYVGSATPFYLSMGFAEIYNLSVWTREWT